MACGRTFLNGIEGAINGSSTSRGPSKDCCVNDAMGRCLASAGHCEQRRATSDPGLPVPLGTQEAWRPRCRRRDARWAGLGVCLRALAAVDYVARRNA